MRKLYADIVTVLMIMLIVISGVMIVRLERSKTMAVEFDGTSEQGFDFGWVDDLPALQGLTQKTVVCWVEQDTYVTDASLMKMAGSSPNIDWVFMLNVSFNSSLYFFQEFDGNNGIWRTNVVTATTGSKHMVAVSYDRTAVGNDPVFYMDGANYATHEVQAPTGTVETGQTASVAIGDGTGGLNQTIDGRQYLVAVFNRILSKSELDDLYNSRSVKQFFAHGGLVFMTAMSGSPGVQDYDGHTFVGSEGIMDAVNGYIGYRAQSPVAVADNYLHR